MNAGVSGPTPDTTPPVVAITSPVADSSVFGSVAIAATATDDVGISQVQFFVDGAALGGPVLAPPYSTIWNAASATGAHVLTAVARDLVGNSTTSAPVTVTVTTVAPSLVGQWGAVFSWPIVPVHALLLPTGQILAADGQGLGQDARLWNPATNAFTTATVPGTNVFCSGHCGLPDGRAFVVGGHNGAHVGVPDANIFNPTTQLSPLVSDSDCPARWPRARRFWRD
jgi:hypothetical protein